MLHTLSFAAHVRRVATTLAAAGVLFLNTSAAGAAGNRGRLSQDLEAKLKAGAANARIILQGTDAEIAAIATKHGARFAKKIRGGAVYEVTGAQLAAMAADSGIGHISSDAKVTRMMAVTNTAIGADNQDSGHAVSPLRPGRRPRRPARRR